LAVMAETMASRCFLESTDPFVDDLEPSSEPDHNAHEPEREGSADQTIPLSLDRLPLGFGADQGDGPRPAASWR